MQSPHLKLDFPSLVILTGAGISAESGIRTFRDSKGLWEEHAIEDVATPEGFSRNPSLVHRFYNARRIQLVDVSPNPAHHALAKLEANWAGPFLLVTQNVDDLHDRAGSKRLIHMHGELKKRRCLHSGQVFESFGEIDESTPCRCCSRHGALRPHIVWFGEIPFAMDEIMDALSTCDLFISIGTSGQVYPAAGFVGLLPSYCRSIEVNPEPTPITGIFQEHRQGTAGVEVPGLVEELLSNPPASRRGAFRGRL